MQEKTAEHHCPAAFRTEIILMEKIELIVVRIVLCNAGPFFATLRSLRMGNIYKIYSYYIMIITKSQVVL